MKKETIGNAVLYNAPMEETITDIQHINHILTDPPYLYIKTHDFDREWNEQLLFENAKRLLPDSGFIALFGRGTSFYRWNTRLAELGFVFKEEIVWGKRYTSAPCNALSRVHETVSIHTKKTGKIKRVKVPYIEQKQFDIESIVNDIKRIKSAINSETGLNRIIDFLQGGKIYQFNRTNKFCISMTGDKNNDVSTTIIKSIQNGMNEKSVIELSNSHYKLSHPTQKPVRLIERILALISDPGDLILDPFMGSGTTGVACVQQGRKFIGVELNEHYFDIACKLIEEAVRLKGQSPELFQESAV